MRGRVKFLTLVLVLLAAGVPAQGRTWVGTHYSPKSLGFSGFFSAGEGLVRTELLLDMNGIIRGWNEMPGTRLRGCMDFPIYVTRLSTGTTLQLIAGPGVTLGYVSDAEKDYGFVGGLTADAGLFFHFSRPISVCFSFSADLCLLYRQENHHAVMNVYGNGLAHAYYPEISIFYRF